VLIGDDPLLLGNANEGNNLFLFAISYIFLNQSLIFITVFTGGSLSTCDKKLNKENFRFPSESIIDYDFRNCWDLSNIREGFVP
jgi:hypothetical protein